MPQRMGPAPICLKISARIAERETYRMILMKTRLFSHWSIPLTIVGLLFVGSGIRDGKKYGSGINMDIEYDNIQAG
jgi:hypothetical protein